MTLQPIDKLMYAIFAEKKFDTPMGDFSPQCKHHIGKMQLSEVYTEVSYSLHEREAKVLNLRFGLEDGRARTLEEVGKEFGVTRERIRQIEAKALRKLRYPSRSRRLKLFLSAGLALRQAQARVELYYKLAKYYHPKIAYVVVKRIKTDNLKQAFKSTADAVKFSCGRKISYCLNCNQPLPPSWNFCNAQCVRAWKMLTIVCYECGKVFQRHEGEVLVKRRGEVRTAEHSYCGRPCFHKAISEGKVNREVKST